MRLVALLLLALAVGAANAGQKKQIKKLKKRVQAAERSLEIMVQDLQDLQDVSSEQPTPTPVALPDRQVETRTITVYRDDLALLNLPQNKQGGDHWYHCAPGFYVSEYNLTLRDSTPFYSDLVDRYAVLFLGYPENDASPYPDTIQVWANYYPEEPYDPENFRDSVVIDVTFWCDPIP